jgi:hypothetical protein
MGRGVTQAPLGMLCIVGESRTKYTERCRNDSRAMARRGRLRHYTSSRSVLVRWMYARMLSVDITTNIGVVAL